ncbi:MAG: DNA ligase D [Burkholderiales bacterium]|nr:DNA ligase D [Burkholderiales bacterium]
MGKDALRLYRGKRNFDATPEPAEGGVANEGLRSFVVQKHWARRLHYDFRLELGGTMKSWAVPKGPSFDPADKRMAAPTEDHPISYNRFEGTIPAGNYGAGKVIIWDKGTWHPVGDPEQGYREGKLKFELRGHKLRGHWTLVQMKGRGGAWLLIKERDEYARPAAEFSVVDEMPDSVSRVGSSAAHHAGPPAGATPAALPKSLQPQLATLVAAPPQDAAAWLYEVKFDGYRMATRTERGQVRLVTRNGNDWTHKLPHLAAALQEMELPDGWYDGEIVMPGEKSATDFQALQGAFDSARTRDIVYYLFDLPYCAGNDLRQVRVEERRAVLKRIVERQPHANVRFSEEFDAPPAQVLASACKLGLEGVIGKRRGSPYVTRRSADWIKLKCQLRQEFVVGGYTDPKGSRTGVGSLLLGVHEGGKLRYAGNVGTGFSEKTLRDLHKRLLALQAARSPFTAGTAIPRQANWVKPELVCEVSFGEWTRDGRIRHSVFHGLRGDKPASRVTVEQAMEPPSLPPKLRISNPDRVIDPESGLTKIALVRYYSLVAPLMMPHLKGRPIAMVRAPDGIGGQLFFQKHLERYRMPGVAALDPSVFPGHEPMLEIARPEGLLWAAQMNMVEVHTWNGVKTAIDKPDRMTFDIDPGEGVAWQQVQEAAELVHTLLGELGLPAFLKTSGGKGLHVVVPLKKHFGWDTVKDFSQAVVLHLAHTLPDRFVARSGPKNRVGRIFIDYLRNGFGATTACAWSARARPGLGISVPVGWDELPWLKSGAHWTVATVHTRLDRGNEPWADYAKSAAPLAAAMKKLGFKPRGT